MANETNRQGSAETTAVPPDQLDEFWRGSYEHGMTIQDVVNELHDFHNLMTEASEVYCHVSDGMISEPNTCASAVIGEHDKQRDKDVEQAVADARESWEIQHAH